MLHKFSNKSVSIAKAVDMVVFELVEIGKRIVVVNLARNQNRKNLRGLKLSWGVEMH